MQWSNPTKFSELTPEEKRMRLNYIRLKMRTVFHVIRFIKIVHRSIDENFEEQCRKVKLKLITEREEDADLDKYEVQPDSL